MYCCNINSFQIPDLQFVFFSPPVGMWVASTQDLCEDIEWNQRSGLRRQLCWSGLPAPPEISCSCSTPDWKAREPASAWPGSTGNWHCPKVSAFTRGEVIALSSWGYFDQEDGDTKQWMPATPTSPVSGIRRMRERGRDPHSGRGNSRQRWEFRGDRSSRTKDGPETWVPKMYLLGEVTGISPRCWRGLGANFMKILVVCYFPSPTIP